MNFIMGALIGMIVISFNPEVGEMIFEVVNNLVDLVTNIEIN